MSFKKGDKVKITKCTHVYENGKDNRPCKLCKGKEGTIKSVDLSELCPYTVKFKKEIAIGHSPIYEAKELQLLKRKQIKYVVLYDEEDGDPAKTFSNLLSLKTWLFTALFESEIKYETIQIFEVKDEFQPKNVVGLTKMSNDENV